MYRLLIAALVLVSCADYGTPGSSGTIVRDGGDDSSGVSDGGVINDSGTCTTTDSGTCEECPEVVECDSCCEECEECPPPPAQDPCSCFLTCQTDYDRQVCLTDMVRAQGLCTTTPGQHYDVQFWCKVGGSWKSAKTWVYPCDETPWYQR